MPEWLKALTDSPFWQFLSVVVIAWLTQRVIAWRERKATVYAKQADIYLSLIPRLAQLYEMALKSSGANGNLPAVNRTHLEIAGVLHVLGTDEVMDTYAAFASHARAVAERKQPTDEATLRQLFSDVTYAMCCRIHGEKYRKGKRAPCCSTST